MDRMWRAAVVVVAFIGVAAALVATVAGLVLADTYRPHAPGFPVAELADPLRRSDQWTDWHRIIGAVLVVAAVASLALVVALAARGKAAGRRKVLLIGAAAVAALTSAVTVITRPLVEWDQLALWSVTVGSDIDGYWTAAFGEDVRFVLVERRGLPGRVRARSHSPSGRTGHSCSGTSLHWLGSRPQSRGRRRERSGVGRVGPRPIGDLLSAGDAAGLS
jgi:nitric oxide reductase large subunit